MDAMVGTQHTEGDITVYQMSGREIEVTVIEDGKPVIHTYSNDQAKALMVALAKLS